MFKSSFSVRFAGLFVAPLCLGVMAGASASAQSLEEALAEAYLSNPTLKAARANLRAVDEGVSQALSGWRPSLSATADAGVSATYNSTSTTNQRQHREPRSVSLTMTQNLFEGGQTANATRNAENTVRAGRASLLGTEQTVLLAAASAYMNVVRDQAVLELNRNNEDVLRRQLEAAQDRFAVGEITRTDVHQAEARLAGAEADRIKAVGDLQASRAEYVRVVGRPPEDVARSGTPTDLPADLAEAVSTALKENPALRQAEFTADAARNNVDQVKGELLPSLDLTGSASRSFEASSQTSRSDSLSGNVTLTVPLYQSGAVYSRLRQARQEYVGSMDDVRQAKRDAEEQATRTWEAFQTTKARIRSFESQIRAAEVALEGVQREAAVGSRTVLDVLDAEQELLDAKVNLIRSQRDELVAAFELKAALGRLTATALGLDVKAYAPEAHYDEVRGKWTGGSASGDDAGE